MRFLYDVDDAHCALMDDQGRRFPIEFEQVVLPAMVESAPSGSPLNDSWTRSFVDCVLSGKHRFVGR